MEGSSAPAKLCPIDRRPLQMTTAADVLKLIKDKEVKFVDLRFTDTRGKEQHVSVPPRRSTATSSSRPRVRRLVDRRLEGHPGSDMLLMPDPATARLDPFMDETTLLITAT
jgi:glutamine synthetase